eukprot:scaffold141544_cov18-Prasinocladus_malaysianus.AAC.1
MEPCCLSPCEVADNLRSKVQIFWLERLSKLVKAPLWFALATMCRYFSARLMDSGCIDVL